jgi:hypothetical protein
VDPVVALSVWAPSTAVKQLIYSRSERREEAAQEMNRGCGCEPMLTDNETEGSVRVMFS